MRDILTIWNKDFNFYFRSRMIYVLLVAYTILSFGLTVYVSDFYSETTINLYQFFKYQTGLMALIVPALTMRLWADEYRHNTLEVLLAQPINPFSVVLGKFLAVWCVTGIMLLATFPFWVITAMLVSLDNWWVFANYAITFWAVGSLCAIGVLAASFCYNALGAFLFGLVLCLLIVLTNFSSFINGKWGQFAKSLDFSKQFEDMIMGQVSAAGWLYFVWLASGALAISLVSAEYKRK